MTHCLRSLSVCASAAFVSVLLACAHAPAALPKSSVLAGKDGAPAIVIDGRSHLPVFYSAAAPTESALAGLRTARGAGVPFCSFSLPLDGFASEAEAARILDDFLQAAPTGYYYLRVSLEPPPGWLDTHPTEAITLANGERLPIPSPVSEAWREEATTRLRARLREIIRGPHAQQLLGVCLVALQEGAWSYPPQDNFADYSPAAQAAFQRWLRRQHPTDARLQKAWNRPEISFDTVPIPSQEALQATGWGLFRDPVRDRPVLDYVRFLNESIAETVAHFARVVKQETQGRALVGIPYGHTFELDAGHHALASLLKCPDIDLLHLSFSRFEYNIGQPAHFPGPVDSVALHGKLAILEDEAQPGIDRRPLTECARRNAALAATHRCGFSFLDPQGDGRWNVPDFWGTAPLLLRLEAESRGEPRLSPEIAVLVDEGAIDALGNPASPFLRTAFSEWRSALDRLGAPVGWYLQEDAERLPRSVKLAIFLNPFSLTGPQRRTVDRLLSRGGTVVWTYAPGILQPDGLSWDAVRDVTGIALEPRAEQTLESAALAPIPGEILLGEAAWPPAVVVTDSDAHVLARYKSTGETCVAAKPHGRGVVVYTALPALPRPLLRWICERTGVHLYHDQPAMTGLIGNMLVVHTDTGGPVHFQWPQEAAVAARIVPSRPIPHSLTKGAWIDSLPPQTTVVYRLQDAAITDSPSSDR